MNSAIILVCACALIVGISYGMHSPIVPIFAKFELHASYSEIGLIGSINYLPFIFAPFLVGKLLDRFNKSHLLILGITLNSISIFLLSFADTVTDVIVLRAISGIAHAFFWPSSEVLITTNSNLNTRLKTISLFASFWVAGFTVGPIFGKIILDFSNYALLFQYSAVVISMAMIPSIFLRLILKQNLSLFLNVIPSPGGLLKGLVNNNTIAIVLLFYAITFGVTLSVYPVYLRSFGLTDQVVEMLYFIFGISRLSTLFFVSKFFKNSRYILTAAIIATSSAMLFSFLVKSDLSFALSLAMIGFATSIFYPVILNIVSRNVERQKMGTTLGLYETIFGLGWAVGPAITGLIAEVYGPSAPYLAFTIVGIGLALKLFKEKLY